MTTAAKKIGTIAAGIVLTAGLALGSVGAANAADGDYPAKTPVSVKISAVVTVTSAGETVTYKIKAVAGSTVKISYIKTSSLTKAKNTKSPKLLKKTKYTKTSTVNNNFKIKAAGTYYVKVTTSKPGRAAVTTYKKLTVRK